MSDRTTRQGYHAFWLTATALIWSAALVGAAFLLPVYGSSEVSSTGTHSSRSLTLVAVNGLGVLIPAGIPLVISAVVWVALHRKCSRGGSIAGYLAWALVAVLALGCLIAVASIGLFVVPVALLLARAAAITPRGPLPAATA
jgi:hypothetical protein